MKLVDKKVVETVFTLELTERELAALVASFGVSSSYDVNEELVDMGYEEMNPSRQSDFYDALKAILKDK